MYQINTRRGLNAILVVVSVVCALWITYVAARVERGAAARPQPAAQEAALEEIGIAPDYTGPGPAPAEMTARPLFNASRRPLPGAAQTASASSGALPAGRYMLTGVSIMPGKREALLLEVATEKTVRVEQNKELNGVLVESVTPTKVTLKLGAEREDILLKIAPASKTAVAAATQKPDAGSIPGQAPSPATPAAAPLVRTPPAVAPLPGVPQAATDVANADPITNADIAEREARVQARRERQSASKENASR